MANRVGKESSQRSRRTGRLRRTESLRLAPAHRDGEAGRWMQHLLELPCARMDRVAQARELIASPAFNLDAEFAGAMQVLIRQELDA